MSAIYPVFDTAGWLLTQPDVGRLLQYPDTARITHYEDEYYAQDWARGCGQTAGLRLYAGISGQVVLAGSRGPYGLTVVIYDAESKFALKYSHLSEVSVRLGEYVLAGRSFVGRVGNTGNVAGSGCQADPGAHLHLALFRNVTDPGARPVTATAAGPGRGPTGFAAPFGYAASAVILKAGGDPAVYAAAGGTRFLVSQAAFQSHGWDFDRSRRVFDPLAGRTVSANQLAAYRRGDRLWPARDLILLRSSNSTLVYQVEDGHKYALSYPTFQCRGLRFGEVREISPAERDQHPPLDDVQSLGCEPKPRRALADLVAFAAAKGFVRPDLSTYYWHPDWNPQWELRRMLFRLPGGTPVEVYRQDSVANPNERYLAYRVEGGQLSAWERMR